VIPEPSPWPGAAFIVGCALVVTACIAIAWEWCLAARELYRTWKLDRDYDIALREAQRLERESKR
jgi:hypothetical protein